MKKGNYSKEQLAYFEAKSTYDSILEQIEIEKEKQGVNKLVTDGRRTPENREIAYKRMDMINQIENKLGKWDALIKLNEAEDNVINWSHEQVKQAKHYDEQKEDMEKLFIDYKKFPKIKEKVLGAALKLVVRNVTVK